MRLCDKRSVGSSTSFKRGMFVGDVSHLGLSRVSDSGIINIIGMMYDLRPSNICDHIVSLCAVLSRTMLENDLISF
jgi:hypothetical protein